MGYVDKSVKIGDNAILKSNEVEISTIISEFPLFDKEKFGKKRVKK